MYTFEVLFYLQEHLVYTIGESAAVGSAGVVLWGDNTFSKSKVQHIQYVFNVTFTLWSAVI